MPYSVTPKRKAGDSNSFGRATNNAENFVESGFSAFLISSESFRQIPALSSSYHVANNFLIVSLTEIPANQISRIFSFLLIKIVFPLIA